jgi:type 1 glutamine amidotransferase
MNRRQFLAASAVTVAASQLRAEAPKKKLVLIAGTPSHGPGAHEFNAGVLLLKKCLASTPAVEAVAQLNGYPKDEKIFDGAAGILIYADGGDGHPFIQGQRLDTIGALMKKGVGLMAAHFGVEVPKNRGGKEFQDWIGGYYEHQFSVNPMWTPAFAEFPDHPVCRGVKPFAVNDEWYFNMRFRPDMAGVVPLLTAKPSDAVRNGPYVYPRGPYKHIQEASGRTEAMMWAVERPDGGRGVGFTGGHFHRNWQDANFRKVVLNALLWLAKVEVPAAGVESTVTDKDMSDNLDPKNLPKK